LIFCGRTDPTGNISAGFGNQVDGWPVAQKWPKLLAEQADDTI
jgi:hypothetical protein